MTFRRTELTIVGFCCIINLCIHDTNLKEVEYAEKRNLV